jgi:hypothetical protein
LPPCRLLQRVQPDRGTGAAFLPAPWTERRCRRGR